MNTIIFVGFLYFVFKILNIETFDWNEPGARTIKALYKEDLIKKKMEFVYFTL